MMPTETAATGDWMTAGETVPALTSFPIAIWSATYAPVIEAVRVPPSAWRTSQSTVIVR